MVVSSDPECADTARARRFFRAHSVPVEEVEKRTDDAMLIWDAAVGKFGNRKAVGHPLVVLVDKDHGLEVTWACAEPTTKQLHRALTIANESILASGQATPEEMKGGQSESQYAERQQPPPRALEEGESGEGGGA